jgi:predicted amidohydrolase YtcJ
MDPARPRADALLTDGARIVAVGRESELARRALERDAHDVDAGGRLVTPGLIDAHTHLHFAARGSGLSLHEISSLEWALERIAEAHLALEPGAWLTGRGHAMLRWSRRPDRADLDRVAPGRAVFLRAKDGHSAWVSTIALERAGVDRATPDPEGGRLGRDSSGELDGLLYENAIALVARHVPGTRDGIDADAALLAATIAMLHSVGVTGFHDFEGLEAWRAFHQLRRAGALEARVWMGFPRGLLADLDGPTLEEALDVACAVPADDHLAVGAIKCFLDGSLGARTAHLLEPYADGDDRGLPTLTGGELDALGVLARSRGLTVCAHAIGDAAVRVALDAFERWPTAERVRLRPRIEHAQLVDDADLPRFARLGVVASMQPQHATSDRETAQRLWGERTARGGYAWRQLAATGARIAFGSDLPVEPCDPRRGLWAAVMGGEIEEHADGKAPARALRLEDALAAYTTGAAWAARAEGKVGVLAAGALADWVVWDDDLDTLPADRLTGARVGETWVDGTLVWRTRWRRDR